MIKFGTHDFLIVLGILNFFCFLLPYQKQFRLLFLKMYMGKYANRQTNQGTVDFFENVNMEQLTCFYLTCGFGSGELMRRQNPNVPEFSLFLVEALRSFSPYRVCVDEPD